MNTKSETATPPPPTHAERICAIVDALAELRRDAAAECDDVRAYWRTVIVVGVQHEQAGTADPHTVAGLVAMCG